MKINIEDKRITLSDDDDMAFIDFVDEIDKNKVDWYIQELTISLQRKKEERQYYTSNRIEQIQLNYKQLRSNEYPRIEEQLDMLYWDKVNGTNNWHDTIAEIKTKYPKPT